AFKLSRALIPVMLETGNASIVNVASEAGLRGNASGNAYTVSKHGVVGLTRSAAFMYGPQGIRVNAVAPGGVATGIAFPPNVSEAGAARLKPFQAQIPTIATAEQIAASITFLLSDDGVNINGSIRPSGGGWPLQETAGGRAAAGGALLTAGGASNCAATTVPHASATSLPSRSRCAGAVSMRWDRCSSSARARGRTTCWTGHRPQQLDKVSGARPTNVPKGRPPPA